MSKEIKNIVSLFDGVSCAQVALKDLGYAVNYYASEIDKYAIEITKYNHPNTKHLGSVTDLFFINDTFYEKGQNLLGEILLKDGQEYKKLEKVNGEVDLLIGGSPCQDLSITKKNREGLAGKRSGLFYEYVRLLKEIKPKYFILENVASMPKEARDEITKELGVQPVMINAALVSAQNRKRLFWVGIRNDVYDTMGGEPYYTIGIPQPEDRNIFLKDILLDGETEDLKSLCITATYHKKNEQNYLQKRDGQMIRIGDIGKGGQGERVYSPEGKSVALSALDGGRGAKTGLYDVNSELRKLHPIECERLQGLPDNYTLGVGTSNTQRYKMVGNAFNVEVIKHIIRHLKW